MSGINKNRSIYQFVIFSLFYLLIVGVFYASIFVNYNMPVISGKEQAVSDKINHQDHVAKELKHYNPISDSIVKYLSLYNPSTGKVFHESSINYGLEELIKGYDAHEKEAEFRILYQLKKFYSMQYFDKKAAWNANKNVDLFKKNLEDCEIGFQQIQNTMQLKEALKSTK